jgi:periplasmic protein TonB
MSTHAYFQDCSRWFAISPVALAVTLALLLLMHLLVYMEVPDILVDAPTPMPSIVMEKPGPIETIDEKPQRVADPEVPPALPEPPAITPPGTSEGIPAITYLPPPPTGPGVILDSQMIAHFKVQPSYPIRAAERGIEGYVVVEFDVTELGMTENIRVVFAEPQNMFERSVLQAVQRWKYKPRQVDGVPVRSYSVRERISFTLSP